MSKHTNCPITPTRLLWLQHLAKHGQTGWERLPKRANGLGAVTNKTWKPMVDAGLITVFCGAPNFRDPFDHYFTITDAGRAAIEKAEVAS